MIFVLHWLVSVARKRVAYEVYEALGMMSFIVSWFLDGDPRVSSTVAFGLGLLLLGVSGVLFLYAAVFLKREGRSARGWEHTTAFTQSGIYGVVRHPVYLCAILGAVGTTLVWLSVLSLVLNTFAIACFRMAVVKEDLFNTRKFGELYWKYMEEVPRLNLLKGIFARVCT